MRKMFILGIFTLLAVGLRAQQDIIHDPNAEVREVKGFHGIDVSGAIILYLSEGDQEKVAVSADDIKWRDRIKTEVVDGVLKIFVREDGFHWNWDIHSKLKAYVSFKTLDKLRASGATRVTVDGTIKAGSLDIHLSGASNFKGTVRVDELSLQESGASNITIMGSASRQTSIHSSGASRVSGFGLSTDSCTVHCSGASNVSVTVNKAIDASTSGSSHVRYKGEAVMERTHSSGASRVGRAG